MNIDEHDDVTRVNFYLRLCPLRLARRDALFHTQPVNSNCNESARTAELKALLLSR